jgi:hypothetical protein
MEIDLKTIEKLEKTVAKAGKTAAKKAHAEKERRELAGLSCPLA